MCYIYLLFNRMLLFLDFILRLHHPVVDSIRFKGFVYELDLLLHFTEVVHGCILLLTFLAQDVVSLHRFPVEILKLA